MSHATARSHPEDEPAPAPTRLAAATIPEQRAGRRAGKLIATLPGKPAIHPPYESENFFGHQPAPRSALPDPRPLLENLTRCVIEILAGSRDLQQISRWVTDDVYRNLLKRVVLSDRARRAKGVTAVRPSFSIGSVIVSEPADGVVEAVVMVLGRARARAVALRLEGLDHRWRATTINVL